MSSSKAIMASAAVKTQKQIDGERRHLQMQSEKQMNRLFHGKSTDPPEKVELDLLTVAKIWNDWSKLHDLSVAHKMKRQNMSSTPSSAGSKYRPDAV